MRWQLLASEKVSCNLSSFHSAALVWLKRPNVCNKLISCCKLQSIDHFQCTSNDSFDEDAVLTLPSQTKTLAKDLLKLISKCMFCDEILVNKKNICFLRKLIPRYLDCYRSCYEFVITSGNYFIFIPLNEDNYLANTESDIYMINFNICKTCSFTRSIETLGLISTYVLIHETIENEKCYSTDSQCLLKTNVSSAIKAGTQKLKPKECFVSRCWITKKLLPKICQWSKEEQESNKNVKSDFPPSLSLLDKEKYTILYHQLKTKYGKELSQVWPEVTDPQKYVYEDVAIAAYLLVLWETERTLLGTLSRQTFIDLGCGNGLLVYILTNEGHAGKGVDIRKRKIWDIYPKNTELEEATVTPSDLSLVQGFDWLLGNHSDELTPWIPVMAARCGYNTRYWVLPCCFFDFYGKYERSQSSTGQYKDYLDFVSQIGEECGFKVLMDVMRIPSTKRVCFVGMEKHHKKSDHPAVINKVKAFIKERNQSYLSKGTSDGFIARQKLEKVKNCTKIDRNVQLDIVETISSHLLSHCNFTKCLTGKQWNRGGIISLSDAVLLLNETSRAHLKNECGGLQTLLRNNHQTFEIVKGMVQIRDWTTLEQPRRKKRKYQKLTGQDIRKTKRCWFHDNHPDGCPRSSEECSFLHDTKHVGNILENATDT